MRRATLLLLGLWSWSAPAAAQAPASAPTHIGRALAGADTLRVDTVMSGVLHTYAWDARGPWAIHVLEVERSACLTLSAKKAGPPLTARAVTSELAASAVAGVNADFFRTPEGTTVGAHVEGGRLVVSPGERPVFAVGRNGRLWIGRVELRGSVTLGGRTLPVTHVNTPGATGAALALFDVWYAAGVSAGTDGFLARVGRGHAEERGWVLELESAGDTVAPRTGSVIFSGDAAARARLGRLAPSDSARWSVRLHPRGLARADAAAEEAVGGFPVLLEGGRVSAAVGGTNPQFGAARHPRTAVGYDRTGRRVWLITVDGRQAPYSDGMTLSELAELMRRLGASDALNLDGGGSTTMVIGGHVVNRPSDLSGERPVGNALLVRSTCR